MPDKYTGHEFRITSDCGKFLYALCEATKNAPRADRDGIVKNIRDKAVQLYINVDRANRISAGNPERMRLQYEAVILRDDIQILLGTVCRLSKAGIKKEAQLELMIERIKMPLENWYASDLRARASYLERQYRRSTEAYRKAVEDYRKVKPFCEIHKGERYEAALAMAESLCRVRKEECERAKAEFDAYQKKLFEKAEIGYTLLGKVLKEIETDEPQSGMTLQDIQETDCKGIE